MNILVYVIIIIMRLYIFDGSIYHLKTTRDLESHPCSFLIINVRIARESYSFYV